RRWFVRLDGGPLRSLAGGSVHVFRHGPAAGHVDGPPNRTAATGRNISTNRARHWSAGGLRASRRSALRPATTFRARSVSFRARSTTFRARSTTLRARSVSDGSWLHRNRRKRLAFPCEHRRGTKDRFLFGSAR